MLPENASDMVDRLSEKAQRSKRLFNSSTVEEVVPDLGLFYKYVVHWSF